MIDHAGWDTPSGSASTSNTYISERVLSDIMTTCVPLTNRVELTEDTLDDLTAASLVYRHAPIDCAMLESNGEVIGNPTVAALFHNGGICDETTGSKLTWLDPIGIQTGNSVASVSNVRTTSTWYNIMNDYDATNNGYIFFNTQLPLTSPRFPIEALNRLAGGTTDIDQAYTRTGLLPLRVPNAENSFTSIGGIPTCATSGSTTCSVVIDRTSLVPCATVGATNWPVCQKPTMWNFFPRYTPTDPTTPSGTFMYPVNMYKRGSVGSLLSGQGADNVVLRSSSWWNEAEWSSFTTMVHYCDFYFAGADSPYGMPRYCDNDPLSLANRIDFCQRYQPQYVFAGMVLGDLELSDLCPWLDTKLDSRSGYFHCLVFADHPRQVFSLCAFIYH